MRRRRTWMAVPLLACVLALAVTACGDSSATSTSATAAEEGTGTLEGDGKEMVLFALSESNIYMAMWIPAAVEEAKRLGYDLRVFQNEFNQTEQDQQVQQYLASGAEPAAVLWFPFIADAAAASVRQLSRVAPVFQTAQLPMPEGVTAYAGTDQSYMGTLMGEMFLELRDKLAGDGTELHSKEGNMLVLNLPEGQTAGTDRERGFDEAVEDAPFNILGKEYGAIDPDSGYKVASQAIPKYKSKGLDFLWVSNLGSASGVIKAAKENGLTPGKDVWIVTGECAGSLDNVRDGSVFGTVLQPAQVEAKMTVRTAAQYLATGEVEDGEFQQTPDPVEPEAVVEPPHRYNWLPMAAATGKDGIEDTKVWGYDAAQICENK